MMLLVSRHLTDYWHFPAGVFTVRINLAWETSMVLLREHLAALLTGQSVFLDIPVLRQKPPCTHWNLVEIIEVVNEFPCVRYVGVSRVEAPEHLMAYIVKLPNVTVVPKIESVVGCRRIADIAHVLTEPKIIMLDHDDLFHDMLSKSLKPDGLYGEYIMPLVNYCLRNDIRLLQTAGVVFADYALHRSPRLAAADCCAQAADMLISDGAWDEDVASLASSLRHKANTLRIVQTKIAEDE